MSTRRHAVVVSYFDQRPIEPLHRLLRTLQQYEAGLPFDLALVINRSSKAALALPAFAGMQVFERENTGMNIGAWEYGWRVLPDYDAYLFLQDECYVVRRNWLKAFANKSRTGSSLVGESMNRSWDRPWSALRETLGKATLPDHDLDGQPANRVTVYLEFLRRVGIEPGDSGRHMRSLIWYLPKPLLVAINGFPVGRTFGECIAAEIGVSRQVLAKGHKVEQVAAEPFRYIRHLEWNRRDRNGPYQHGMALPGQEYQAQGRWRRIAGALASASGLRRLRARLVAMRRDS